jgi:hypothetical protein
MQALCLAIPIRSLNLSLGPSPPLDAQLHGRRGPILAVVVAAVEEAGAGLGLLVVQHRQHAEDDGDAKIQLRPHQAVRHGVRDVLEVHRLALDEHTDGDYGVECRRGGGGGGELRQVSRGRAEEVASGGAATQRRGRLDLGGCVETTREVCQLVFGLVWEYPSVLPLGTATGNRGTGAS